uniref:Kinesin motor domain-containing protein n=1 Tax=Ascaris lumbricoides TaxID=6252 RepID=A0A9J2P9A6_ASCLU
MCARSEVVKIGVLWFSAGVILHQKWARAAHPNRLPDSRCSDAVVGRRLVGTFVRCLLLSDPATVGPKQRLLRLSPSSRASCDPQRDAMLRSNAVAEESSLHVAQQVITFVFERMERVNVGMHVDIRRSDGRVHNAVISEVRKESLSVTVEWFENGHEAGGHFENGATQIDSLVLCAAVHAEMRNENIKKEIFYMVVLKKVYGLGERKDGGEKSDTLKIASKAVYREEVEKDNIKVDAYLTKEQGETKGKEIDLKTLLAINPTLAAPPPSTSMNTFANDENRITHSGVHLRQPNNNAGRDGASAADGERKGSQTVKEHYFCHGDLRLLRAVISTHLLAFGCQKLFDDTRLEEGGSNHQPTSSIGINANGALGRVHQL